MGVHMEAKVGAYFHLKTRNNGTQRAQTLQKEVLKLHIIGAMRRSVPRYFLQDSEIKRCMVVRVRPNVLSRPEML